MSHTAVETWDSPSVGPNLANPKSDSLAFHCSSRRMFEDLKSLKMIYNTYQPQKYQSYARQQTHFHHKGDFDWFPAKGIEFLELHYIGKTPIENKSLGRGWFLSYTGTEKIRLNLNMEYIKMRILSTVSRKGSPSNLGYV